MKDVLSLFHKIIVVADRRHFVSQIPFLSNKKSKPKGKEPNRDTITDKK